MHGPILRRCRIGAVQSRELLRFFYHPVGKRPHSKTAKAKSQEQDKDRRQCKRPYRALAGKARTEERPSISRSLREKPALCQKSGSCQSRLLEPRLSSKYLYVQWPMCPLHRRLFAETAAVNGREPGIKRMDGSAFPRGIYKQNPRHYQCPGREPRTRMRIPRKRSVVRVFSC